MSFDVVEASIAEMRRALDDGTVTAVGLLESYLARIAAYDSTGIRLNAVVVPNPQAHAEAEASDERRARGAARWTESPTPPRTVTSHMVSPRSQAARHSRTWWRRRIRSSSSGCGMPEPS